MAAETLKYIEGYNPSTANGCNNLLSRHELMNVLQEVMPGIDMSAYIAKHYTCTVIDGCVVYYVE
jgi:hypothetical protein